MKPTQRTRLKYITRHVAAENPRRPVYLGDTQWDRFRQQLVRLT